MQLFRFQKGYSPLLVCNAHSGSLLLPEIKAKMTEAGQAVPDTDWHLLRILDLPVLESAAVITANLSKYVVDLLADVESPEATTMFLPLKTKAGEAIYLDGQEPDQAEIAKRIEHYFQPFHQQLENEAQRLLDQFGRLVVVDVHSSQPIETDIELRIPSDCQEPQSQQLFQNLVSSPSLTEATSIHQTKTPLPIARRFARLPGVVPVEIFIRPKSYLDPDDGGIDFDAVCDLKKLLDPLLVQMMKWSEQVPAR